MLDLHRVVGSRVLYIWGHAFELRAEEDWAMMEELCALISNNDKIWYATNIEIYDYVQAYKSLRYSANGCKVYNPTLYTIWLEVDAKMYSVKPGETICIEA